MQMHEFLQVEPDEDASSVEREPTEPSDCTSIPSEHEEGLTYREYTRRYVLKVVTITHGLDSHGLFDFEKL